MLIDLTQFTWEAFATLFTGALAATGAVIIGLRQTAIAKRQAEILGRQVALDELKLRSELFERRWAIYDATREFLAAIMRSAAEPERECQTNFLIALNTSEFLFDHQVKEELSDIWKRSCSFFATHSVAGHLFRTTGSYGQDNIERETAYLTWLGELMGRLGDVFGDELKLTGTPNLRHMLDETPP